MSIPHLIVLYTAIALGANQVAAADVAALEALRDGDMRKLLFSEDPTPAPQAKFLTEEEEETGIEAYRGEYVLLNFWATWCAPCREEMPSLNALQKEIGGDGFQVVTVATGRNPPAAIRRFFEETGVDALPKHRDPRQELAREMGVLGLPVSVLLDPEGREIARLRGDADWDSDSAKEIFRALLAGS